MNTSALLETKHPPPPPTAAALSEFSSFNLKDDMLLHTSKTVQEWLKASEVEPEALTWAPDSPDLNPIKHPPDASEQA